MHFWTLIFSAFRCGVADLCSLPSCLFLGFGVCPYSVKCPLVFLLESKTNCPSPPPQSIGMGKSFVLDLSTSLGQTMGHAVGEGSYSMKVSSCGETGSSGGAGERPCRAGRSMEKTEVFLPPPPLPSGPAQSCATICLAVHGPGLILLLTFLKLEPEQPRRQWGSRHRQVGGIGSRGQAYRYVGSGGMWWDKEVGSGSLPFPCAFPATIVGHEFKTSLQ